MKTSAIKAPGLVSSGEKEKVLTIHKDELFYKLPVVVLVVALPGAACKPMQLVYANRGLLMHTGHDPIELKASDCDFYDRLLVPAEKCKITRAVDFLLSHPREEINGLVFKINATWDECLYVICSCRLLRSDQGGPLHFISNWQVYDKRNFPKEAKRDCMKMLDRTDNQK
jgi:hypothetical protein